MKLNERAFALSAGVIAGACSLLGMLGWSGMYGGMMMGPGMMYGGGIGSVVVAFLVGLVGGYAFAWLYNAIAKS